MNVTLADLLAVAGTVLGSIGTLLLLMWNLLNGRFDKFDVRLESLERKLTDRVEDIRHELTARIDTGIKGLDTADKALGSQLNTLEKLTDKIDTVEQKLIFQIDTLETSLNNATEKLSEKIGTMRDRISRIEGHLIPTTQIVPFDFEVYDPEKPKKRLKT